MVACDPIRYDVFRPAHGDDGGVVRSLGRTRMTGFAEPLPYRGDGGGVHIGVVALLSRSDSYAQIVLLKAESYDRIRSSVDASPAKLRAEPLPFRAELYDRIRSNIDAPTCIFVAFVA